MTPPDASVAAVILAAGASRRMGVNKLLLEVEGEPMVRRAVRRALDAGCDPVVVVTGHEGAQVREVLVGLDVRFAESADPTGPTSGSLHAGLRALPPSCEATIVLLSDMVRVSASMLRTLVADATSSAAPLAASRYGDVLAPPLMFRRSLWPELLAYHGEGCGKSVVTTHLAHATLHDWPVDELQDVDTPEDYEAVR